MLRKPAAQRKRRAVIRPPLDPHRRIGFVPASPKPRTIAMPIELKMPALSPTMEEGTLAKWLVKEGDTVKSGDILAEIETDKATMEFEAVDEGTIAKILVAEGTDGVKVGSADRDHRRRRRGCVGGSPCARAEEADAAPPKAPKPKPERAAPPAKGGGETPAAPPQPAAATAPAPARGEGDRVKACRSRAAWPRRRASTSRA